MRAYPFVRDQGKGKKGWSDAQRFGGETSLLRAWMVRPSQAGKPCSSGDKGDGKVKSTSALLSLAATKAGVKKDQGELEDLERFGVSDHYVLRGGRRS